MGVCQSDEILNMRYRPEHVVDAYIIAVCGCVSASCVVIGSGNGLSYDRPSHYLKKYTQPRALCCHRFTACIGCIRVSFIKAHLLEIDMKLSVWKIRPTHSFGFNLRISFMYLQYGFVGISIEDLLRFLHRTPIFYVCFYAPPDFNGNMDNRGYIWYCHGSDRQS